MEHVNEILATVGRILHETTTANTNVANKSTERLGAYIGAGITMVGGATVGLGQGYIFGKAVEALARNPEVEKQVFKLIFIGSAISESSSIYSLLIAFILIFVSGA